MNRKLRVLNKIWSNSWSCLSFKRDSYRRLRRDKLLSEIKDRFVEINFNRLSENDKKVYDKIREWFKFEEF